MKIFIFWKNFVHGICKKNDIVMSVEADIQNRSVDSRRGTVLILSFMMMIALTSFAANYLYATSIQMKNTGFSGMDDEAFWLAEAGLNKAIWNLMTPTGSGGQGDSWTTAGTIESLGAGSYTMVVDRWDWALSSNSSTASGPSNGTNVPSNAIDNDNSTYWESALKPLPGRHQAITVRFPYPLTLNKVSFVVPSGSSQEAPKDYTWNVSSDGTTWTSAAATVSGNSCVTRTDEFTSVSNVVFLQLDVEKIGGSSNGVRIATLEALGSKITSTGTVNSISRKVSQTAAVLDGVTTPTCSSDLPTAQAYAEKDWIEMQP